MQNRTPIAKEARPPLPDFTPVPRKYRHDGWTPERQKAFISALADTGSVSRAAAMVNMAQTNCYTLRRAPGAESFRRAWEAALDFGLARLKDIAFERAIDGYLVPVFVAGGIGRGEAILSYLEMGAAGVQLGTRFVCARESIAHANFKQAFIRGNARDAMPTIQLDESFPVIPVRALQNQGTKRFLEHQAETIRRFQSGELTKEAAQLDIEHFWAGALRRAVIDGDVESGSLMAGQSVGMVTQEQTAAEIIAELREQAAQAIMARSAAAAA